MCRQAERQKGVGVDRSGAAVVTTYASQLSPVVFIVTSTSVLAHVRERTKGDVDDDLR